jgi:heat shock protein HslJ
MKALKVIMAAVILLAGILTLNACQSLNSPLEGYNWVLFYWFHASDEKTLLPDTEITAYFNDKDKTVSGSSGCNQYSGTYTLDGLTLTINDNIIITEMYCSVEKNEQERLYLEALKNATNFVLDHGHLKMYCGDDIMQFKREGASTSTPNQWGE